MITPETFQRLKRIVADFEDCVVSERCGSREERLSTEADAKQARDDIDELKKFFAEHFR